MTDQRLSIAYPLLDNINQRINDAPLQTQKQIEIAKTGISIDQYHLLAPGGQAHADIGSGGSLANAALSGGYDDHFTHLDSCLSIVSITIELFFICARSALLGFSIPSGDWAIISAILICTGIRQSATTTADLSP